MALLTVFTAVAGWHLLSGDQDCGCFGAVVAHPAWIMTADLAGLIALLAVGRQKAAGAPLNQDRLGVASPVRVSITIASAASLSIVAAVLSGQLVPRSAERGEIILLDPVAWVGQPCPLLEHLDEGSRRELSKGRWAIILFDRHCQRCLQYIARRDALAARTNQPARVRAIDISATGDSGPIAPSRIPIQRLTRREDESFLAEVPVEFVLDDGFVVSMVR